ncbi:hypothetical protein [Sphingomonas turrisvirgatae]|uniref:Uncharacterized protein n=1 Tax=Sphingomonas turrisvirgatae TaxID=1888892 RepID=A0A1E3LZR0_9SPHN|nr:hypothetical protein [Sphingomonas turrisvirgatae]ODP39282.1 hypothetical protein BFL28_10740 [Sphingomonas turrisvirgatae]
MSIKSTAFGRVVLTDADAKKFVNQVTYGKPKQAARESVARGLSLSRQLRETGSFTLKVREQA